MAAREIQDIYIRGIEQLDHYEGAVGFPALHVLACNVSCKAKMISHPVETGFRVFDNKVLEPRTISFRAIVDAADTDTKKKLRIMWRNRLFKFYTVVTREATYKNLCCTECSHEEGTEMLDKLEYSLRFEEVMEAMTRESAKSTDDANVA